MDLNYLDYLGIRVALGATLPALGQTDLPAVTASEVEAEGCRSWCGWCDLGFSSICSVKNLAHLMHAHDTTI